MAYKKTGRKPGRPRKELVEKESYVFPEKEPDVSIPEMAEDFLPKVSHSDTQSGKEPVVAAPKPAFPFTEEERERIRVCDDVYLVTKNAARLENGGKDKQVHNMAWLKEVV